MPSKTTPDGKELTAERIKGFRKSYREFNMVLRPDITDDGEAFLFGAVHAIHECGCKVTGNGTLQFPLTIKFCKRHAN